MMMGDMADDRISGWACSDCGIYFEREHGYPVLCGDCYDEWTPKQIKKAGVQKAHIAEM